jgi:fructose-1-phosphate kinase PfkB-like protein
VRQDPGGKGVNVASCLADWGVTVTTFGLLGGQCRAFRGAVRRQAHR